jgi:hypothetical protein
MLQQRSIVAPVYIHALDGFLGCVTPLLMGLFTPKTLRRCLNDNQREDVRLQALHHPSSAAILTTHALASVLKHWKSFG